jgi:aminoglycoside phosphotransferase (APT) family kinase protein
LIRPTSITPAGALSSDLIPLLLLDSMLPKHIATRIMALIEHLAPGDGLCHADLHPENVIMTAEGPRVIDWLGAVCAPAALDLAYAHVILSEISPEQVDDPERPRAVNVAVQSEYARLAGMPPAALTAARELYLPHRPHLHPRKPGTPA